VGGGGESGVVVPADPGADFEVVEAGFQFPGVVLDAPAGLSSAASFLG